MFVDDLTAVASDKLDREVIELFDLALKPNPIYKKHRYVNSAIPKMCQVHVLES